MRNLFSSIIAVGATLVLVVPAESAPPKGAASDRPEHGLTTMLDLRLRSIELQVDTLADRGLIGREEAQELRSEARRLEQRLYKVGRREAGDVEIAVGRLQEQLRFAADDGLSDFDSRRRDLGRFDDGERYERDQEGYYRNSYERADPRGDPFAIWQERDDRELH